ncbi:unnamed protein product [Darwinula stevensoni]|uniref:Immunoglobulin I-set domain-containing protein n=1 Tax=Darwinula stevensoni TaxID=69355 RepID=A0A7R8XFR4_9CRUS|nr:unnamed protein product [Darwinula stevensoni]CAG0890812.1 unnamed protein product [Darwinula stevensoni]
MRRMPVLASGRTLHLSNGLVRRETEDPLFPYKFTLTLEIQEVKVEDFGVYECHSRNSLGNASATVNLYEIQVPGQREMDDWRVEEEREKEEVKVTVVKVNVSGGVGPLTSRDSINQKSYILLLMPLLVLCQ